MYRTLIVTLSWKLYWKKDEIVKNYKYKIIGGYNVYLEGFTKRM